MTMKRTVILAVTADEYELPVAVADTQVELSQVIGISESRVSHALARGYSLRKEAFGKRIKIVRVPIGEEDEDG